MSDLQDPLPEPSWRYRRIYTFAATLINSAGVGFIVWKLSDDDALKWVALALIGANMILVTMYLLAPSADQFGTILHQIAAWKQGIRFGKSADPDDGELPPDQRVNL